MHSSQSTSRNRYKITSSQKATSGDEKVKSTASILINIFVEILIFLFCRSQREEDLRENHPLFDTPLFIVPRESKFRKVCQLIVYARYDARLRDPLTGKERKVKHKQMQ